MKILFAGTPEFGRKILDALIASKHEVVLVLTQPSRPKGRGQKEQPSPVEQAAVENNIPVVTASPSKPEVLEEIKKSVPDAAVVAAYGRIFRPAFLNLPPKGVLNVHPSLLPRWRGAAPVHAALLAGDKETGVAIMRLVEEMDAGPIYAIENLAIEDIDDRLSLENKLAVIGGELLLDVLDIVSEGLDQPQEQEHSAATFTPKMQDADAQIQWNQSAIKCLNRVRAFAPDPGAWFNLKNKEGKNERVKILSAQTRALENDPQEKAGTVLFGNSKSSLCVACDASTALELLTVRPEGKKDQPAASLVHGKKLAIGDRLL